MAYCPPRFTIHLQFIARHSCRQGQQDPQKSGICLPSQFRGWRARIVKTFRVLDYRRCSEAMMRMALMALGWLDLV